MIEARTKHYVVWGDPLALARARQTRGRFYDSQKHIKLVWGIDIKKQHDEEVYFQGPVFMDVIFYMAIPTTASLKKKEELRDQYHIIRPDNSNLLKFVEDVGTTICYHDDCILAKQLLEKVYDDGKGPRTEFILRELLGKRQHRELI